MANKLIEHYRVNSHFILLFVLTMGLNGISVAWTTGGSNQTASIFAAKFNWSAEQTRVNNSIINFASQIGKTIGAYVGGRLIMLGRRPVFLWANVFSILACLIMQVPHMVTLTIGKFLHGILITIVQIAAIKMINETVPVYKLESYGPIVANGLATGYLLVLGLGAILPSADYNPLLPINEGSANKSAYEADKADENWRLILAFPILINAIMLVIFQVYIGADSIMYSLSVNNEDDAMKLIEKIYHADESKTEILNKLKKQVMKRAKNEESKK